MTARGPRTGICAGPSTHTYSEYWPTILNTLATFLLVFYASQVCALGREW